MNQSVNELRTPAQQLFETLGALRAEDLGSRIFEFFARPGYFDELESPRSCVLIGGRGTGKTTVLRGLSFEGQRALRPEANPRDWPYYGLYYRVNTTRVRAFSGSSLNQEDWGRLFAHYVNLSFVLLITRFLLWYETNAGVVSELKAPAILRLCRSLHLNDAATVSELSASCELGLVEFESFLNNIRSPAQILVSMPSQPIDLFMSELAATSEFRSKHFFFLIDEYENFLDDQQRLVNTMIKHRGPNYSFKIGVREEGWRVHSTLDLDEHVTYPADYALIDIDNSLAEQGRFSAFAEEVFLARLHQLNLPDTSNAPISDVRQLFPGLTFAEEAKKLGLMERTREIRRKYGDDPGFNDMSEFDIYFVERWAEAHKMTFQDVVHNFRHDRRTWDIRIDNYRYSALFSMRRGRIGISKYYCGWETLTLLAGRNIRYLLELLRESLIRHWQERESLTEPVSAEVQTQAAQEVGLKNLTELQANERFGGELGRIVFSLGRVLGLMAADPWGHAPEMIEFRIQRSLGTSELGERVDNLVNAGVRLLAFKRSPGSKPGAKSDTRDFDYRLHPIYSAFFGFSHRKKRRFSLSERDFVMLADDHRSAIATLVSRTNRELEEDSLPSQLRLFEQFFDA